MFDVAERLRTIEAEDAGRFAALSDDDTFVSVAVAATQAAFRARHAEKRQLLANAVENSAAGTDLDPDLQLAFVRFVDELTPGHVRLLEALESGKDEVRVAAGYKQLQEIFRRRSGIDCTKDQFMLLCSELTARALLSVSRSLESMGDVSEADYIIADGNPPGPLVRVTEIGLAFLTFVAARRDAG